MKGPRPGSEPPVPTTAKEPSGSTVTAKYPNHVFNVDLTVMPTVSGFWVPWVPEAWRQVWPFAWWIGIVMDHYSRRIVGKAIWHKEPTANEVTAMLDATVEAVGLAPKHIISDQGVQFQGEYLDWCAEHGARPRFGAVGRYGSIAVLERFMRTFKEEGLRRLVTIPLRELQMAEEVTTFVEWFNQDRPHQGLAGATPNEVYFDGERARNGPRYDVREPYPTRDAKVRAEAGTAVELRVHQYRGRAHLPVIELRQAAGASERQATHRQWW